MAEVTVVNPDIVEEGLDPNYQGMPRTGIPGIVLPWWVYVASAIMLYLMWGED